MEQTMRAIAHIHSDFPTKFGIPRQSGLVDSLRASIVFEPAYRDPAALRGIEAFSHLWLLWHFSEAEREGWSPTVRPPRMGGNTRMGVFATRSPFRPNAIGLSCVRLEEVVLDSKQGPMLRVSGADLMDGTPIFDIKPYLPGVDSHPDAVGGFADQFCDFAIDVDCSDALLGCLPPDRREALLGVLAQDPRPSYQNDPDRVYGLPFAGFDVKFRVREGRLTVCAIEPLPAEKQDPSV